MINFISTVVSNIFAAITLVISFMLVVVAIAFKIFFTATYWYGKCVYKTAFFFFRNFGVILSVVFLGAVGYAIVSPRDPNFISQDHPDHPINVEL